ncbi:unnamed protein product [Spirodela intermedia]|uniref:Uncharacterized protein n=1 Tax=Spirodela intermedia TaxID=51605 RepID=A0A7I8IHP1_SPIIN|nr:unnamed protein product [Spirodela intermedia]CAA6657362.1 unnamed protein product [Spirodela intermedia]
MSGKLLNEISEENQVLQRRVGCMMGIFQMLDRHRLLSGRRLSRKRLPPGGSAAAGDHLQAEENHQPSPRIVLEKKNLSRSLNENQRVSRRREGGHKRDGGGPSAIKTSSSKEQSRFSTRLQELPRLSLDSKQGSLMNSNQDSRIRSAEPAIKPTPSSRIPIEPAPWKQPQGKQTAHRRQKLKVPGFQQSNKDFRALERILEAIHAKGLMESKRRDKLSGVFEGFVRAAASLRTQKIAARTELEFRSPMAHLGLRI